MLDVAGNKGTFVKEAKAEVEGRGEGVGGVRECGEDSGLGV